MLAVAMLQWGCERPLLQPTSSSVLIAVAVACEPRAGTPSSHAYCSAWCCFSDGSTEFITPTAVWESSDHASATVERGIVALHMTGDVHVTATYRWRDGATVAGAHRLTITERGCVVSNPSASRLCDGASPGTPGLGTPGTCPR